MSFPRKLTALPILALLALTGCSQTSSSGSGGSAERAGEVSRSRPAASASQIPAAGQPAFWPRFHGPKGDNISTEVGLLKSWPDGGPKLLWTAEGIGEGYSSVSIANGLIYVGSWDRHLYAFGLAGGAGGPEYRLLLPYVERP